jgi:protein-tyrosine phosphatase
MIRLRSDPTAIKKALAAARRVLIVCQGNIIRSPIAERLLRLAVAGQPVPVIFSAGLDATAGTPAHPWAVGVAARHHLDLADHRAARVSADDIDRGDVVFAMDLNQLVLLRHRFPTAGDKVFLLTCLAPDTPLEVRDPIMGDESEYSVCFDHLLRATTPIGQLLRETAWAQ